MRMLLQMSVAGSVLICVILVGRAILQNYVRRTLWLWAWAVAVVRLLLPVFIPLGILPAAPALPPLVPSQPVAAPAVADAPPAAPDFDWMRLLFWLWAAVAVLLAGVILIRHLRACRYYRQARPLAAPPCTVPIPGRVRLCTLSGLPAPLTCGLFHPVILLPEDYPMNDAKRLEHIVLHELVHIRRHDIAKKAVLILALCLHWFNPLVWLMAYLCTQDMEMRCDAEAIAQMGGDQRLSYAKTLVAAEEYRIFGYFQLGFSYSSTGARVKAIARSRVRPLGTVLAALLLAVLLLPAFFSGQAHAAQTAASQPAAELPTQSQPAPILPAETEAQPLVQPIPETQFHPNSETAASVPSDTPTEWSEMTEPPENDQPSQEPTEPSEASTEVSKQEQSTRQASSAPVDPAPPAVEYIAPRGPVTLQEGATMQLSVTARSPLTLYPGSSGIVDLIYNGNSGSDYLYTLCALRAGTTELYYSIAGAAGRYYATVSVLSAAVESEPLQIMPPQNNGMPDTEEATEETFWLVESSYDDT